MRIGIFGGSFDPIHLGHLILAEECRVQANLDQVIFIPAFHSPLKSDTPRSKAKQRLEMLSLALGGQSSFQVSRLELDRGGRSYTVDTLNELKTEYQDDDLFLLMGQDSLATFDQWKSPDEICKMAIPLIVRRPGMQGTESLLDLKRLSTFVDPETLSTIEQLAVGSRLIDISSTDIRQRVADGKSIRYLVPRAVEKYIETQKLFLAKD
ncbi:MAG: nicotinate-nucleotide adenylyltransferase [Planctomycetota bacterium]